jgi:hypothetical protein
MHGCTSGVQELTFCRYIFSLRNFSICVQSSRTLFISVFLSCRKCGEMAEWLGARLESVHLTISRIPAFKGLQVNRSLLYTAFKRASISLSLLQIIINCGAYQSILVRA